MDLHNLFVNSVTVSSFITVLSFVVETEIPIFSASPKKKRKDFSVSYGPSWSNNDVIFANTLALCAGSSI